MSRKWLRLVLILGLILVLAACSGQKGAAPKADAPAQQAQQDDDQGDHEDTDMNAEDHEDEAEDTDADSEETTEEESAPEPPPVVVADIYAEFCASCHGDKRQGNPGPPLLPENLTEEASVYATTIKEGKGSVMPAWKDTFNDEIIQALAEWLKTPVE